MVLLGAPGAGKGTQSELLCARLGIPHISTGDLLREAQNTGTRLGKVVASYVDRGQLVPDDVITGVVEDRLKAGGPVGGFALDGFPRTIPQASRLADILGNLGAILTGVLVYEVPEGELIRRLGGRRVCGGCGKIYNFDDAAQALIPCSVCGGRLNQRADDNPDAIRVRLRLYTECTQPVVEFYDHRRMLRRVDAVGSVEEIYLRSLRALGVSP